MNELLTVLIFGALVLLLSAAGCILTDIYPERSDDINAGGILICVLYWIGCFLVQAGGC